MGIIVLTLAILPILGVGGMQLFVAEAPGTTPSRYIHVLRKLQKGYGLSMCFSQLFANLYFVDVGWYGFFRSH
jgi:trk system potassium uptake protein